MKRKTYLTKKRKEKKRVE